MICQEDQNLTCVWIKGFDASKGERAFLHRFNPSQLNQFILENISILRHLPLSYNLINTVLFHSGDKVDPPSGPSTKEFIIIIGPIIDHNGSGIKLELVGYLSAQGGSDSGGTEINDGRIHPNQPILESKLLLSHLDLNLTPIKEFPKDFLVEFPGTVLIGIGQGRMGRSGNSQMPQLPFTTPKPPLISRRE